MRRSDFRSDIEFWNASRGITSELVEKLNNSSKKDLTARVLRFLLDRASGTAHVLMTLAAHHEGYDYTNDALALLRTIYDASLQALWLVHDSARIAHLTEDFIQFAEIERNKLLEEANRSTTSFATRVMASP